MWCASANAVLTNCHLTRNAAHSSGGGAYSGTLNNCALTGNSASESGSGAEGSILNNCTLAGNSAYTGGGASDSTLNNCTLTGNSAEYGGGAYAGTLNNCTLVGNSAYAGGGVYYSTLNNCIVYYNTAARGPNYDSYSTLNFCCTTPLPGGGTENITADPQLASASHLSADSPCRGAGGTAYATGTDIDGEPWATPPSIGCDEYRSGSVTGALAVAITARWTNVAVGFELDLMGAINGRVTASAWDFGHGAVLSNQPYATHAWNVPGDYPVVLRACNETSPDGVSATFAIRVVVPPVHYVDAVSTTPVSPFTNWHAAAQSIQDAVDAATVPGALILVSNGVYGAGGMAVAGLMTNRVAVYKPLTLTSVNGPEFTFIRGCQAPGTSNGDGAIRCAYLTRGAVLSGFTLTNGHTRANSGWQQEQSGGGVWCESTNALVTNCLLTGNSAQSWGGGAYGGTLSHCTLTPNSASYGGGASGCTLNDCTLIGNSGDHGGGASGCTLYNCTLTGNRAFWEGGGVSAFPRGNPSTLYNCTLTENSAGLSGGGASGCTLHNCTLTRNSVPGSVPVPVGMFPGSGGSGGGASGCTLYNCIVYYNTATNSPNYDSRNSTLNFCCTTPLPSTGFGNITNEPLFVDQLNGNLRLQRDSPCVDAGNNACVSGGTDLDGSLRIARLRVDMGAYEYQGAGISPCIGWLQQYGLPTDGSADYTDSDHDGLNNWQEWQADTDPTNAASCLHLTLLSNTPPVAVVFSTSAARLYTLQRCTNMTATAVWTPVPGQTDIPGNGDVLTLTDTNPPAPAFYRVSVRFP